LHVCLLLPLLLLPLLLLPLLLLPLLLVVAAAARVLLPGANSSPGAAALHLLPLCRPGGSC
jgi:hypothetical protein